VAVLDLQVTPEAGFVRSLSLTIKYSQDKAALIFIHGYDVKFDEAARNGAGLIVFTMRTPNLKDSSSN
jgi:esterase/lipase superfamily enzyme